MGFLPLVEDRNMNLTSTAGKGRELCCQNLPPHVCHGNSSQLNSAVMTRNIYNGELIFFFIIYHSREGRGFDSRELPAPWPIYSPYKDNSAFIPPLDSTVHCSRHLGLGSWSDQNRRVLFAPAWTVNPRLPLAGHTDKLDIPLKHVPQSSIECPGATRTRTPVVASVL